MSTSCFTRGRWIHVPLLVQTHQPLLAYCYQYKYIDGQQYKYKYTHMHLYRELTVATLYHEHAIEGM